MWKLNLITKEKLKKAVEGKLKNEPGWEGYQGSINDDLEGFLLNLQNQNELKYEEVSSFFTPKLTNEEFKLVQERNKEYLKSYAYHHVGGNPDIDLNEMKKSDSKSKYIHGSCWRETIHLTL